MLYGQDYLTDPTPPYLPNQYTLDDKKILELDENSVDYDRQKDTKVDTIIDINEIKFSKKGSFNTRQNWKKTKLIEYFKQIVFNMKKSRNRKTYKGNFYYIHKIPETYYGVNNVLKGRNLIGKVVQKMYDDQTYIPRIQQKIKASQTVIDQLHSQAENYNNANKTQGWGNIKDAIYFYNTNEPYYEFTNFFGSQVYVDGIIWPTSEHYYQSMKFTNNSTLRNTILEAATPRGAFTIAQNNAAFVDKDWKQRRLDTMIKVVWLKFNQHDDLKELLLTTDKKILVENAGKNDAFYGAGGDYKGQNWLGCILMAVRNRLALPKEQENTTPTKNKNEASNNTTTSTPKNVPIPTILQSSTTTHFNKPTPPKTESWLNKIWAFFANLFSLSLW